MIKSLIGIRLRSAIGGVLSSNGKRRPSVGKAILFSILFLYLGVVFAGLFTMMALGLGTILLPRGGGALYFGLFMAVTFSVVFVFSANFPWFHVHLKIPLSHYPIQQLLIHLFVRIPFCHNFCDVNNFLALSIFNKFLIFSMWFTTPPTEFLA